MANFLDNIKRITGFEPEDDDFEYDIDLDEEFEEEEEEEYTPVRQQPAAPAAAPAAGSASVTSPMPGNILDVKVKVGDVVNENTVVVLLEAMKMENEIFAGANGKVTAVNVAKGATVNSGDVLVVIG